MLVRSLLTLFVLVASAVASSPAEAVAACARDVAALPEADRPYARYFSLYSTPAAKRAELLKVITFWANSLSREAEFGRPRRVADGLYAVDLRDYAWKPEVWERLRDAEPYFHALVVEPPSEVTVTEPWPGGVWPQDGRHYAKGAFQVQKKVTRPGGKKVQGGAPWVGAAQLSALIAATQSQVPVVRADWWLFQAGVQKDRKAGYYDFLGLGARQKDFEDLAGADREKSRALKKEVAAVLALSGVTLENRAVLRFQSLTGGFWVTQDFKTSVDRQNVLRHLDQGLDPPGGDASEQYAFLPNGLLAFWLQNDRGERQDVAPDFIASDGQSTSTDRRVHVGLSCVRCHAEGIRPIDDWARRQYRGAVRLASPDYEKYKRLRQLYLSDLEDHVRSDQAAYAKALAKLTGWKPPEAARAVARAWEDYADRPLTPADFARELGTTEAFLLAALKAYAAGGLDPVLAGLIQDPPLPLRRSHAEEAYSLAQAALRGYTPAPAPEAPKP